MIEKYIYLLILKFVTVQDLQRALSISKKANKSVEAILINNLQISKEAIGRSLSSYYNCPFIAYDPKMPIATEMFQDLQRSLLLKDCWVPISWDEKGIVIWVDDPLDREKKVIVEATFESCPIIYAVGIEEDIEAFRNLSLDQLEIDNLFLEAESGESSSDVTKIVDNVLICL